MRVAAALRNQLRVRALLEDPAVLEVFRKDGTLAIAFTAEMA